jgi:hypothetical protein
MIRGIMMLPFRDEFARAKKLEGTALRMAAVFRIQAGAVFWVFARRLIVFPFVLYGGKP